LNRHPKKDAMHFSMSPRRLAGVAALACAAALTPVTALAATGAPATAASTPACTRPATVSLADGATATAGLQVSDPGNFGTACFLPGAQGRAGKLRMAAGLRVYPPNQFTSKVIPLPFYACYGTAPVWMYVKPVQG
jgi:Protein of unknown function (DUF4232)